ncbi:uncharacterized protein LOC143305475 isoform X3 [Osmia lignaria lignaria]|uniref:uncharacterized protein LOC143305475 isoform X3 n=1 Tax=Osmia lignaria lignaria TaxID=1437193 RepID=UPI00402B53C5
MTDTYYRYTASAHVLYYCYNITLYVIQSLNRILPFSKMNSLLTECSSVYHELTSLLAEDVFVAVIFPRYYVLIVKLVALRTLFREEEIADLQ